MKKDALIIMTPGFAASEDDSTCLPMQQQLVKMISDLKPEVEVIVLTFQYPYHTKPYWWNGICVFPFDGRNRGGVKRLLLRKKVDAVLHDLKRQHRIRGLLSFWLGECALVGKRFGEENNIPHLCWLLGQDARKGNKYVTRANVVANELIALSDSLQEEFEKNYGIKPCYVVSPGVVQPAFNNTTRDIDILGVGSLIPLKRYEILIETVASIKKIQPSVKALLIGEGMERKRLTTLIEKYDLKQNVELTGSISHGEVLSTMQRSRVLIHPSEYEGFSGVCMEALSCGVHVVSFCKPMNHDINHWYIVDSRLKMIQLISELLKSKLDHEPVLISSPKTVAEKIIRLFHLQEP